MSTFRKTVMTTAIIGAGLASTAGTALAHDGHGHEKAGHETSSGCSNSFRGETGDSENAFSLLNDSQGAIGANICDVVSHNNVLSGNDISMFGTTVPTIPDLPGAP